MPHFAPPTYKSLIEFSKSLVSLFKENAELYNPPPYEKLCSEVKALKTNYAKRKKSSATGARLKQINLLVETLNHLSPKTPENNPLILLGAIFFRYGRLKKIPKGNYGLNSLFRREDCTLSDLLGEMLNINNLSQVDWLTLSTCHSVYYAYLKKNDHFKSYAYIADNDYYLTKLEKKVAVYQDRAKSMQVLSDLVEFIVSLQQQLAIFESELTQLIKQCFSKLNVKNRMDNLAPFLESVGCDPVALRFLTVTNFISAEGITGIKDSFITSDNTLEMRDTLLKHITLLCHYALIGGYLFVLKELDFVKTETASLKNPLLRALGASESNIIDKNTAMLALRQLWIFSHEVSGLFKTLETKAWVTQEKFAERVSWQYINEQVFYQTSPPQHASYPTPSMN